MFIKVGRIVCEIFRREELLVITGGIVNCIVDSNNDNKFDVFEHYLTVQLVLIQVVFEIYRCTVNA